MTEPEFQLALKETVEAGLRAGLNPFMVLSLLETAKLDLYQNMRSAQAQQARAQIVRGSLLPPHGFGKT